MLSEYAALVAKVEGFTGPAFERSRADMVCARGCASCCLVWLTVNQVEAANVREAIAQLPNDVRLRLAERGAHESQREASAAPRCAMLEDDGSCAIYAARPLVCRTQGFALRYPAGFIPVAAVRTQRATGDITHCPLNFTERAPEPASVLDAERVDQILAVVNRRYAEAHGVDPAQRHALSALAASALFQAE